MRLDAILAAKIVKRRTIVRQYPQHLQLTLSCFHAPQHPLAQSFMTYLIDLLLPKSREPGQRWQMMRHWLPLKE